MFKSGRDHLNEVQEGYFEHLGHALLIAARLAKAALACTVHAFMPGVCTRTASRCVAEIQESIERRAAVRDEPGLSLTEMILGGNSVPPAELVRLPLEDRVAA